MSDLLTKALELKSRIEAEIHVVAPEVPAEVEEIVEALPADLSDAVDSLMEEALEVQGLSEEKSADESVVEPEVAVVENDSSELEIEEKAEVPSVEVEEKAQPAEEIKSAYRPTIAIKKGSDPMEIKEFEMFLRRKENKFQNETTLSEGGYLVHEEFYNQLITKLVEKSPIRQFANVITISGKAIEIDRVSSNPSVFWTAEGGNTTPSDAAFNRLTVAAHSLTAETQMTYELLDDAAYDIVNSMTSIMVEEFMKKESQAFISGTGVGQPEGLLTASGTIEVTSGSAATFGPEDLSRMLEQFKYDSPYFMMNRTTFEQIRRMQGTTNDHFLGLIDLNVAPTGQNTFLGSIHGVPVIFTPELASAGANAYPIILADLKKAYSIVDRKALAFRVDDLTLLSAGKVKLVAHRRVGGAVVRPDAIVKLKCAV